FEVRTTDVVLCQPVLECLEIGAQGGEPMNEVTPRAWVAARLEQTPNLVRPAHLEQGDCRIRLLFGSLLSLGLRHEWAVPDRRRDELIVRLHRHRASGGAIILPD